MQMRVLEVRVLGVERAPGSYRKASWLLVGNGGVKQEVKRMQSDKVREGCGLEP